MILAGTYRCSLAPQYMPAAPPRPKRMPRSQSGSNGQFRIKGGQTLEEQDSGHRGDAGAHKRRAGNGIDRQAEEGHEEGGDNRAAADPVHPADETHDQAQGKDGQGGYPRSVPL